jgi:hypothetical protein
MAAKINKHVFHGVYSNFGYRPNFTHEQRLASFPIHFFRASFGELENGVVKEFQTEEEVLKWYKKNKLGQSQYNELKFPDDFCKNYFVIPESELYKYKNLFHGMIKGLKVSSDIEISSEGTAFSASCPETKSESGDDGFPEEGEECSPSTATVSFQSPNGEPSYFTLEGGADDIGFLNGTQISDGTLGDASGAAGPFNQEKIPKTKETTLTVEGKNNPYYCGPYGINATVTWYTQISYKQKINFSINFDSTKIFDFPELQKRLPADNLEYITNVDLEEDKNKEELVSIFNKKVFKDEWQFDLNEFKSIFKNDPSSFNYNATFINDPVLIQEESSFNILNLRELDITLSHIFNGNSLSSESVNKQKNFQKKFNKFGSIDYKIENENSIISSSDSYLDFYISNLFYIKNQKKYLLFIEIDSKTPLNGNVVDKEKDCGGTSTENYDSLSSTNPLNIDYILTTNDSINNNPLKYKISECSDEEKELEFKKTKCKIKLSNKTFEIESFQLKDNQFIFDNNDCEDLNPHFRNLIKNTLTFKVIKTPIFEILEWKDTDFDKNNIFPPKLI